MMNESTGDTGSNFSVNYVFSLLEELVGPPKYTTQCANITCFCLYGVFAPLIAVVGILGNSASILTLLSMPNRSSLANVVILTALDNLLLLASLPIYPVFAYCKTFNYFCDAMIGLLPRLYPITLIVRMHSVIVCLLISSQRYLILSRPLTASRSNKLFLQLAVAGGLFSSIYNIPAFFELVYDPACHCLKRTAVRLNYTYFLVYRIILKCSFEFLMPLLAIICLNIMSLRLMHRSQNQRKELTIGRVSKSHCASREFTCASLLIVFVFVLSEIVPMINHFIEVISPSLLDSVAFLILVYVGNIPVILGAAADILIYCAAGSKFRKQFRKLFLWPSRRVRYNKPCSPSIQQSLSGLKKAVKYQFHSSPHLESSGSPLQKLMGENREETIRDQEFNKCELTMYVKETVQFV